VKRSRVLLYVLVVVVLVGLGVILYLKYSLRAVSDQKLYIGLVDGDDSYTLIDPKSFELRDFIPGGYDVVDPLSGYEPYPDYLLLSKDGLIYSYDLRDRSVRPVAGLSYDSGWVDISPSISEANRFYIRIVSTKQAPIEDEIVRLRGYLYDAESNKVVSYDDIIAGFPYGQVYGILAYDSKYSRFFINPNREPIKSSLPLLLYDIESGSYSEVISLSDLGIDEQYGYGGSVYYGNGYFVAFSSAGDSKIVLVEPTEVPTKIYLGLSDRDFDELDVRSVTSALYIKEKNMVFLGYSSNKVGLLRFDEANNLIDTKFLYRPGRGRNAFVGSPYTDGENVYYDGEDDNIFVIDLDRLEYGKDIRTTYSNIMTLFR